MRSTATKIYSHIFNLAIIDILTKCLKVYKYFIFSTETSSFNANQSSPDSLTSQTNEKPDDLQEKSEEKLPFDGEYNSPLTLSHLQEDEVTEPGKKIESFGVNS